MVKLMITASFSQQNSNRLDVKAKQIKSTTLFADVNKKVTK